MSILIVDDTPDNILLIQAILAKEGYQDLISAASAEEAYQKLGLRNAADSSCPVDLILMDFMMPAISGVEACRTIKSFKHFQDIPLIMVTARTEPGALEEAFQAGAMDYITKPVRKYDLMARLKSALKLKKTIDQLKERERTLSFRNEELEKAAKEIKTLRGFIPICAHCKEIRNMEGRWQQMESYFHEHSEVKFSHGICDKCMRQVYPDYVKKMPQEGPST